MRRWYFIGFCLVLLLFPGSAIVGQRIIVNSNGERIVMYPDGSWRLADAGDSTLVKRSLQKSESPGPGNQEIDQFHAGSEAEQHEYILKQWNELHFNLKAQEKKVLNEFRAATNAQFSAAEIYHNAIANKKLIEPDRLATITENYESSVRKLRFAKANQNAIKKLLDQSKKLGGIPSQKMVGKLNTLRSKFNLFMDHYYPGHIIITPPPADKKFRPTEEEIISEKKETKSEKSIAGVKSTNQTTNTLVPPPNRPRLYRSEPFKCKVIMDMMDEATGIRKKELEPSLIFTHTDPDLRQFFKNKELITCYGKLSKIDQFVYLMIDFQVASSHSQSNFGSLEKGSLLRLRLLNGEYVSLYNIRSDRGRIDAYSGHTIFSGQYALGKDDIKMLLNHELDKVRILWTTGYEDYDVYKIDFFRDQLNCLTNK